MTEKTEQEKREEQIAEIAAEARVSEEIVRQWFDEGWDPDREPSDVEIYGAGCK